MTAGNKLTLLNTPLTAAQVVAPDTVLSLARQKDLKEVMVVGWTQDGDLFMSGSHPRYKDMFWLLDNALTWVRNDRDS